MGTRKIIINDCYGGFGLSGEAAHLFNSLKGEELLDVSEYDTYRSVTANKVSRDDPILIEVFDMLGKRAAGELCELRIIEIPDDVDWVIQEYDGNEWVAERHRVWR